MGFNIQEVNAAVKGELLPALCDDLDIEQLRALGVVDIRITDFVPAAHAPFYRAVMQFIETGSRAWNEVIVLKDFDSIAEAGPQVVFAILETKLLIARDAGLRKVGYVHRNQRPRPQRKISTHVEPVSTGRAIELE